MQVPYMPKWQKEADRLRKIARDCGLAEAIKWGKPCFTYQNKNVAIVIPLKDACALSFFKGALLTDPAHVLEKVGAAQAPRWIKFTSPQDITAMRARLCNLIGDAMAVETSGQKVALKDISAYPVPPELQARLDASPQLRTAFAALTPGRKKSYILHVAAAKQAQTRAARAQRCIPMILSGRGFNESRG